MLSEAKLYEIIEPEAGKLGFELVRALVCGGAAPVLQVMIERIDRAPITADDCAKASRAISPLLDEADPSDEAYTLEVSSPGIDRPLTKAEHFERFAGFEAKIESAEAIEGRKRFKGRIVDCAGGIVRIEMEGAEYAVPVKNISKAKLVLNDELWAAYEAEQGEVEE